MSTPTWGLDPKARRISVYYTESSTIYEGMPVCYEFDATTNWMGVDGSKIDFTTTASTSGLESTSTAEGNQNEGKFIRVEDPDDDNIHAFAGVVAGADHEGTTGPRAIDIYIPNGAVVPVRTDQSCTCGKTVLAVHNAEQALTAPFENNSWPVAIAWEDNTDVAGDAGLVLAKLDSNMFIRQRGDSANLIVDDQDSGSTFKLNTINVDFTNTSGTSIALCVQATSSAGASASGYGIAIYGEGTVSATPSSHLSANSFWLNITGGTPTTNLHAGEFGIWESGANLSSVNMLSCLNLNIETDTTNTPGAGKQVYLYLRTQSGHDTDAIFATNAADEINMTTASSVTCSHKLPFYVGDTCYYIECGTTTT
jgi:hypothetical protein